MKKIILLLTALLLTAGVMQSQVKIGQDADPEKGAILDLNDTAYKGGLLLPNVDITDLGKIPMTFSDESVRGLDDAPALAGLLVWNTHPGSEGVYMWDGANWQLLTEDSGPTTDCSGAPTITSISGFSGTYNLNAEFDVTCNATTTGVTLYTWTVPAGLTVVSGNGTRTVRLKGTTAGTYNGTALSCTVSNACSSATITSVSNVTVNSCSAAPATPGAMTLSRTSVPWGGTFTAVVDAVAEATSYSWSLPSGLSGTSSTNSITITATTHGSYATGEISVVASNTCGISASSISATTVTVTYSKSYYWSAACWATSGISYGCDCGSGTGVPFTGGEPQLWASSQPRPWFKDINPVFGIWYYYVYEGGSWNNKSGANATVYSVCY